MLGTVRRRAGIIAVAAFTAFGARAAAAAPDVVVSIAPVHSLVAAVMVDLGSPKLLVPATASQHVYTLRPSDAKALAGADIVFHVSPDLETFLAKPLAALASGIVVTLAEAPGITEQPTGEHHAASHGASDDEGHASEPHIWLSVANARRIAEIAADTLVASDPDNAQTYRRNLANLKERLHQLERDLRTRLEPVRRMPYVVMHDAYRHFETEFGLRRSAAIALSPERRPGARQLYRIRNLLAAQDIKCVFAEPQFPDTIAATVVAGTNSRLAQLDPVGVGIPPGPELYFTLMKNLGRSLAGCLGG